MNDKSEPKTEGQKARERALEREKYNTSKGWRDILVWPDSSLTRPVRSVSEADMALFRAQAHPELKRLLDDLEATCRFVNAWGLAAPQIGVGLRAFVIKCLRKSDDKEPTETVLHFLNPEVTYLSAETQEASEGCLSIPGISVPVKRHAAIRVRATGYDGEVFEFGGDAGLARAVQHELDHLEGKLVVDSLSSLKRNILINKYRKAKARGGLKYITPFERREQSS